MLFMYVALVAVAASGVLAAHRPSAAQVEAAAHDWVKNAIDMSKTADEADAFLDLARGAAERHFLRACDNAPFSYGANPLEKGTCVGNVKAILAEGRDALRAIKKSEDDDDDSSSSDDDDDDLKSTLPVLGKVGAADDDDDDDDDAAGNGNGGGNGGGGASPCNDNMVTDEAHMFDRLSIEEMDEASAALLADPSTNGPEHNLQIPSIELGPTCFNYVYLMDPFLPTKAEALATLDNGAAPPSRYARVTVNRGCQVDIMEYKVGPLGEGNTATVTALTAPGAIKFEARPRDGMELRALKRYVVEPLLDQLRHVTRDSFGMVFTEDDGTPGQLDFHGTAPPGLRAADRLERMFITVKVDGTGRVKDLHALPLQWRVNATGSDPTGWVATDIYYNRQGPFATAQALIDAYDAMPSTLQKVTLPADWSATVADYVRPVRPGAPMRALSDRAGADLYEPSGKRFRVKGHSVEWMGWSLHVSSMQQRGPTVKDVRFMGERVAYEISANEVTLVYSANDPVQGNVMYFDATFGQGETANAMRGIDCPDTAVYVDDTWWAGSPRHTPRAFCVFEQYTGAVLWRRQDGYHSGLREHQLVVRTSLPVGNYDYYYDFKFTLDGEVHVAAGASGNMQTYFHAGDDESPTDQFGNRVYTHTTGALHDHHYSFKVDMDVGGETGNWVDRERFVVGPIADAFANGAVPPYIESEYNVMRRIERSTAATEADATYAIDLAAPEHYHISNHASKNAFGLSRAYQVVHSATTANTFPDGAGGHPIMVGGTFRKYHVATTVRKEHEVAVNTNYALNELLDTNVTLDAFIGGESVEGADLVSWVSFGFLHLPRAEDMPVQQKVTAGFALRPYNYFDENPALDLPAQVVDMRGDEPVVLQSAPAPGNCAPSAYTAVGDRKAPRSEPSRFGARSAGGIDHTYDTANHRGAADRDDV